MKKIWFRILILAIIFAAAAAGLIFFMGRREREAKKQRYESMAEATLPVIYTEWGESTLNVLHGYVEPMEAAYVRDTITPVAADRSLTLSVRTYGQTVTGGKMFLYSLDGSRFLEEQELTVSGSGDVVTLPLQLTALLDAQTEYRLELELSTQEHPAIYFYTRVISEEGLHVSELMQFARSFSDATFDKETAKTVIVPYLLPNDTQTNDSFAYANQNSSFATITWGDMGMTRADEPAIQITEITPTQISVTLSCRLTGMDSYGVTRNFTSREFFCVRWRDEKMYLLSYERNTAQNFTGDKNSIVNGNIWFGIAGSGEMETVTNSKGDTIVFCYQDELWGYNSKKNEMVRLFTWKESTADLRNDYDQHGIHIVRLDEEGNVYFMVYGYLNRGSHEGTSGICFYRYDSASNSIREQYYIPVNVSYQILKEYVGSLSYVNDDNLCFLLFGDRIYSIDLNGSECLEIISNVRPGSYAISADGSVIMWQEESGDSVSDVIHLLNMNTGRFTELKAEEGDYLSAEGFLQNDLVYGRGHKADIIVEAGVETVFPLYSVEIMEMEGQTVEETYRYDQVYITDVVLEDMRIRLLRAQMDDENNLQPIAEDILILNEAPEKTELVRKSTLDTLMRRCYYIALGTNSGDAMQFSTVTPAFEPAGGNVSIEIVQTELAEDTAYYVYGNGGVLGVYTGLREAIQKAYDSMGVVLTGEMENCWNRDSRALTKSIALDKQEAVPAEQTLAAAMELLLRPEGISQTDLTAKLNAGLSPVDILTETAGDRVESLYGCTVAQILYYLNLGQPVMAVTGDREALIITGYTTNSVNVYDPATALTEEWSMERAEEYFAQEGNRFITVKNGQKG